MITPSTNGRFFWSSINALLSGWFVPNRLSVVAVLTSSCCVRPTSERQQRQGAAPLSLASFRSMSHFKKFTPDEISSQNQVKSSVQRAIRAKVLDSYPWLEESGVIDTILPKKEQVMIGKCPDHVQLVILGDEPLFFAARDDPWLPTLRLLHKYPLMMNQLRVDTGAIKFVLSGANIMSPGLTSPGATIHTEVEEGAPVAIYGENKEHAMAVGVTKMSTKAMREVNKGIGVDNLHYLNDGLWKTPKL